MTKIKLNEMIDILRKEQNLTLEELGLRLGKSKSAISRWIKGDRSPMIDDLEKLAFVLNTDVLTLLYGKRQVKVSKTLASILTKLKQFTPEQQTKVLQFVTQLEKDAQKSKPLTLFPIKVIEKLAAGVGYAYENNTETTYYTTKHNLKMYDIASLVTGDSMQPLINDGDVVLIKKDSYFVDGKLYAVDYDGKSYLKKVYFTPTTLRLVSINEKYDDILINRTSESYLNIVGEIVDWFTPIKI